jgi:transcriptional regulator with XRE-family HTH domain
MPNIDQGAKSWELDLSARLGAAVQARRKALKMTAQQLAERTQKLGYPITRVAISKIETNNRAGKFDVAELLVLAVALDIPPVLLLFPSFPEGTGHLVPTHIADAVGARQWLCGSTAWMVGSHNDGIDLVQAVANRHELDSELFKARLMEQDASTRRMIAAREARLAAINAEIGRSKARLWGTEESESSE